MKFSSSMQIFFLAVLTVLFAGCSSPAYYTTEKLSLKNYNAEMINPEKSEQALSSNARFCEGGWLLNIYPKKDPEHGLLHDSTVIEGQHCYGLPDEFWDDIPRVEGEKWNYIRIGVGTVRRTSQNMYAFWKERNSFWDKKDRLQPWEYKRFPEKDGIQKLLFRQHVPDWYDLEKSVSVSRNDNRIRYEYKIRNISKKKIEVVMYWHPFFRIPSGKKAWIKAESDPNAVLRNKLPDKRYFFSTASEFPAVKGKDWYIFGYQDHMIGAFHVPNAATIGLWFMGKNNLMTEDVFAIEPKLNLNIQPMEVLNYNLEFLLP